MGAVKMTSGPDSRFPMTLERPVHHPLWPRPDFTDSPPPSRERAPPRDPRRTGILQETGAFFGGGRAKAVRRRGKKGKWRSSSPRAATYSSFDALPPPSSPSFHLLPPQPFFITSPHSCPSDSNAPTNLSVCGMPNLIRYYTFQQRQITTLLIRHPNPITSIGAFHRKTQFMKRRVRGDSTIRRFQTSKGAQGVRPTPKPFAPS